MFSSQFIVKSSWNFKTKISINISTITTQDGDKIQVGETKCDNSHNLSETKGGTNDATTKSTRIVSIRMNQ